MDPYYVKLFHQDKIDAISGYGWPPGKVITLDIDDPETSVNHDYTVTETANLCDQLEVSTDEVTQYPYLQCVFLLGCLKRR